MTRWTREPLARFLTLGALIFAANAAFGPRGDAADRRIVVSSDDIAGLRAMAQKQWGREPTPEQMSELVRGFVREEVLVREAVAGGLDRGDVIVRRRLAQKMEFLAQGDVRAPSDAELRAGFAAHSAEYAAPATLVLEQLFFSRDLRGDRAHADATLALTALRHGRPANGDRSMLGATLTGQTESMLAREFGSAFAQAAFSLPPGAWSGPIDSLLGVHLVRIISREATGPATLADVRERVRADLLNQRVAQAREQAYAQARERYSVTVAGDTWRAGAGAKPAAQP